jgi:hypothetical protein
VLESQTDPEVLDRDPRCERGFRRGTVVATASDTRRKGTPGQNCEMSVCPFRVMRHLISDIRLGDPTLSIIPEAEGCDMLNPGCIGTYAWQ